MLAAIDWLKKPYSEEPDCTDNLNVSAPASPCVDPLNSRVTLPYLSSVIYDGVVLLPETFWFHRSKMTSFFVDASDAYAYLRIQNSIVQPLAGLNCRFDSLVPNLPLARIPSVP